MILLFDGNNNIILFSMGQKYSIGEIQDTDLEPVIFTQENNGNEYLHMSFPKLVGKSSFHAEISLQNLYPKYKIISVAENGYKDVTFDPNRIYLIYNEDTMDIIDTPANG